MYEFQKEGEEELIAAGFTDWVFVNGTTFMPTKIPADVAKAYNPEYPDIEPFPKDSFPESPPNPSKIYRHILDVEFRDIDQMKHLNNAAYLTYAEEAAMHLSESFGWPLSKQLEDGIAFVARKNQIQYLLPALPGDEIEITTWLYDLKSTSGTRYFRYTRSGTGDVLAELHMLWVMIDTTTGKPTRLPAEVRSSIESNLAQSVD
jgi:acyl-CoA thioester hydrolase